MKLLYDEVIRRFPEVRSLISEGNEDLPYVVVDEKDFNDVLSQYQ